MKKIEKIRKQLNEEKIYDSDIDAIRGSLRDTQAKFGDEIYLMGGDWNYEDNLFSHVEEEEAALAEQLRLECIKIDEEEKRNIKIFLLEKCIDDEENNFIKEALDELLLRAKLTYAEEISEYKHKSSPQEILQKIKQKSLQAKQAQWKGTV